MKYKGMNENTIRRMLQSNETALLQKGVTDMLNTITNTTDNLLSSFSIEKFFSNKNFSDLSTFVKDILKQVEDIGNKASGANLNSAMLQKTISEFMKDLKINTKTTSESVNKIASDIETKNKTDNEQIQNLQNIFNPLIEMKDVFSESWKTTKEDFRNITDKIINTGVNGWKVSNDIINNTSKVLKLAGNGFMSLGKMAFGSVETFQKEFTSLTDDIGNNYIKPLKDKILDISTYNVDLDKHPLLSKILGRTDSKTSDYSEEQSKDEEKQRSITQNKLAESQLGWLQGSLMPWLKKFGEEQRLESDGFIATFFPMLASMINASPLLLKLIGFAKMFLTIGGAIFGAVKFIEGIQKAVDVLGHEIDFTSLKGWLEALNLGIGNIISSITGIDLKRVYKWLDSFDRTLANAYKRYLAPIFNSIWKTVKETVISAYNTLIQPVVDKINNFFNEFAEKFPAIVEAINDVKNFFIQDLLPLLSEKIQNITSSFKNSMQSAISFMNNGDDTDWNDFLQTLLSPIETISTGVTEIMKYMVTIYEMFTKSQSITDFFNPDKWKKTFDDVEKSSFFTGNKYADEINRLNESSSKYLERISEYAPKKRKYEQMSLSDFDISSETYSNYKNIWDNIIKEKLSKEEAEALDRITKNYDFTEPLSIPQMYARDKQIMEDFKRSQITGIEATVSGYRKYIEENDKRVEELKKQNEKDKFIDTQVRRNNVSREKALELWNRMQSRTEIEPLKSSKEMESQNEMSATNQAEMKADETKPAQPTINANGSGNVITNNNYNNTTSNIQSGLNEQQMMESAKNTGM
ncbi:hypothetical protein J6W34_03410 [bacterium]|nr:hypothetical protein [bacterium]